MSRFSWQNFADFFPNIFVLFWRSIMAHSNTIVGSSFSSLFILDQLISCKALVQAIFWARNYKVLHACKNFMCHFAPLCFASFRNLAWYANSPFPPASQCCHTCLPSSGTLNPHNCPPSWTFTCWSKGCDSFTGAKVSIGITKEFVMFRGWPSSKGMFWGPSKKFLDYMYNCMLNFCLFRNQDLCKPFL